MAIITRNATDLYGAPSQHTLVPFYEHTKSHFCNYLKGGVHLDIIRGGPLGAIVVGPWRDTVEGQDVVITASAEQRGTLSIEESDEENPSEAASSLVLGDVGSTELLGGRVKVTSAKYRVTFTPSATCDRVHVETQSRA